MVIVAVGVGLAVWLLVAFGRDDPLGAIRTAGTVVVGSGGGAALFLAARRQRSTEIALVQKERDQADVARAHALQERVAAENRANAVERRITELYTKSVEQLGSDKAPVRLGGLYALERLAQDNEHQRQTIVNVLCAYLRMPYRQHEPKDLDPLTNDAHLQEREVRLTAQRLLTSHLRADSIAFWEGIRLDPTGAFLIDFTMVGNDCRWVSFKAATFVGSTIFLDMAFPDYASFDKAMFLGDTHFTGTTFTGDAKFEDATFRSSVEFDGYLDSHSTNFARQAKFQGVTFEDRTSFSGATFNGRAPSANHEPGIPPRSPARSASGPLTSNPARTS
ncbi:pentapeptide repeat-containing protein [Amycolatopsis pigmentata]|uniref:Pentapeptide repeat-containing protein n=1 Tax=Amycolatopsis pigmentata TaxID=450801 RepID=A0ABW5FLG8_9PSEU